MYCALRVAYYVIIRYATHNTSKLKGTDLTGFQYNHVNIDNRSRSGKVNIHYRYDSVKVSLTYCRSNMIMS